MAVSLRESNPFLNLIAYVQGVRYLASYAQTLSVHYLGPDTKQYFRFWFCSIHITNE